MLLQLTVDLINKGNLRREFCINGIICSSAIQLLSTTGKKKPHKAKTPNPVLLNCTTEYLKKGNVNAFFTILQLSMPLDYLCFSQMYPFLKSGFFYSLKICISTPFLSSYLCKPEMIFRIIFSMGTSWEEFSV